MGGTKPDPGGLCRAEAEKLAAILRESREMLERDVNARKAVMAEWDRMMIGAGKVCAALSQTYEATHQTTDLAERATKAVENSTDILANQLKKVHERARAINSCSAAAADAHERLLAVRGLVPKLVEESETILQSVEVARALFVWLAQHAIAAQENAAREAFLAEAEADPMEEVVAVGAGPSPEEDII